MNIPAILIALLVLIVGLYIVIRHAWEEWQRPFFKFDEEQAKRDVEELLADANKPKKRRPF